MVDTGASLEMSDPREPICGHEEETPRGPRTEYRYDLRSPCNTRAMGTAQRRYAENGERNGSMPNFRPGG